MIKRPNHTGHGVGLLVHALGLSEMLSRRQNGEVKAWGFSAYWPEVTSIDRPRLASSLGAGERVGVLVDIEPCREAWDGGSVGGERSKEVKDIGNPGSGILRGTKHDL